MKLDRTTVLGLALVAVAAAVLTFTTLFQLAVTAGYSPWLAWLLPIAVDAAGLVALRVWLRHGAELAKRLALSCIALSVAGNATQHGLAAYGLPAPWWVIVVVSAVPPSILAAVVHLVHVVRSGDGLTGPRGAEPDHPGRTVEGTTSPDRADHPDTPGSVDETGPVRLAKVPAAVRDTPDTPDRTAILPASGTDPLLPDVVEWSAKDGVPSSNAIVKRYGVGRGRANKLLEQLARSPV